MNIDGTSGSSCAQTVPAASKVRSAPGLIWKTRAPSVFEARWACRADILEKGYPVKSVKLWTGTGDPLLEEWEHLAEVCRELHQEMLGWLDVQTPARFNGTLGSLMECYKRDPDSSFRKLRYASRRHYEDLMRLLREVHGREQLMDLKARTFLRWHEVWTAGGKTAIGHSKIGMLRTLFGFGATILEDPDCQRLQGVLSSMRFAMPKARVERLTAEQATAIRLMAHEMGRPSIALAQAFQFELMLRQKDVIGEMVPMSEPGDSDIIQDGMKWLRGIRWEEIDADMTLRHVTSKRQKEIVVSLRNAPMVMEEISKLGAIPPSGPIVVSEWDNLPWTAPEFRRWWRIVANAAGVPKTVRNMDSRAGGITEATEAGADLEFVRHAATHSNISMTQRYSRGAEEKIASVQMKRVEHRNKFKEDTGEVKAKSSPLSGKGQVYAWLQAHVDHIGLNCLKFPFAVNKQTGYAQFGLHGKMTYAHQWMCEQRHGPRPSPKHEAAHSCGNAHMGCINPNHIDWKTRKENAQDRLRHGNYSNRRGEPRYKLTAKKAAEIMALKDIKTQIEIAEMFGVSRCTVSSIHCGRVWAGVGKGTKAFSKEEVFTIRERHRNGEKIPALAREFDVSHNVMWKLCTGKTYQHEQ